MGFTGTGMKSLRQQESRYFSGESAIEHARLGPTNSLTTICLKVQFLIGRKDPLEVSGTSGFRTSSYVRRACGPLVILPLDTETA